MKTVPSEIHDTETYEDPIPDAGVNIGDFKITKKINPPNFFNNSRNEIECQSSESETLIVCNNELATSFQTIKSDKHKLNPGHYLQKVFFNSVAQKFRSQSLPNSLEKKKFRNTPPSNAIDELNETSVPLVEATDCRPSVEAKEAVCESWFKTWPERGIDKVLVQKDDSFTEEKVQTVTSDEINGRQNLSLSNGRTQKADFSSSEVTSTVSNKYFTNRENRSSCVVGLDENKDCNASAKPQGNTIPLDKLLDNFPLAYSPVTKQLHLISSGPVKPAGGLCENNVRLPAQFDKTSDKLNIEKLNLEEVACDKVGGGKGLTGINPPVGLSLESDLSCNILHRVNTEVSSFSSTVSSLSDNSPSTNEDSALGSLLDHGDTCSLVSLGGCSAFSEDSLGEKSKKKTLTGFFSRNVFNWKSGSRSEDSIGWKLFGKSSSPQPSHASLTVEHYAESDGGSLAPDSPCSARSSNSGRLTHCRVASSSALIQLDRPPNLPAKSEAEEAKHRQQYQEMLEAARKKELKDAKQRKKQIQTQLRAEEQLAQATRVWTREILPRWDQMHSSKKARELWWQGVPPCVRGKVWRLAISNPLNLTHSLYDICVQRAQDRLRSGDSEGDCGAGESDSDNKEASMQLIQLDISRTFPHLCIFQKGGPYYDMLHCLLAAYVCYRPDVGYVQGMSFIAAVLLLNMEAADAFVCFANLLNRPCHMAFFHLNQPLMQAYYSTYNELFKENLPQLYCHFSATTLTPDLYLLDWIYTVFSKAMSLDVASRVWDVFLRDGEVFLFRTALGILHLCQDRLLQMDFVHGSQYLTRLPDDLSPDQLFKSIGCIKTTVGKLAFDDILALHSSSCQ